MTHSKMGIELEEGRQATDGLELIESGTRLLSLHWSPVGPGCGFRFTVTHPPLKWHEINNNVRLITGQCLPGNVNGATWVMLTDMDARSVSFEYILPHS
jgi:hypothetical protein